ncbi:MAG: response regulator transcription factor [Thermaurantimonas sp.]
MTNKPHILLIEDDDRLAKVIAKHLREHDFEASLAYDGMSAIKLFRQINFDLIITDVMIPGKNGIDLCREIRQYNQTCPIIMLTALGTTDDKLEGFDAGANDYMVKPFEIRELIARIRVLLKWSGLQASTPEILQYADVTLNLRTKKVTRNSKPLHLTPKELKLLEYMLRNPDRILTRQEISENVWETRFDTGTNFIDVYINYLRKKIDKESDQKLIHTRPGLGFILSTDP